MAKKDRSQLEKDELIRTIERLESRKKYGLVWDEEKTREQFEKESENALPVLKEVKSKEIKVNPKDPFNVLIEGDNYHSLSVLNYTHHEAVDVIYIDPPYNTGNQDFKYNDHYVDKEDTYRHSEWLSFMNKRLRLAKSLLKDKGVIFISIDDNEIAQLKLLCNEVFSEDNLIAQIIWRKKYGGGKGSRFFVDLHEYILCYAKDINKVDEFTIERTETQSEIFSLEDKYLKDRGRYYIRPLKSGLAYRKNLIYPIKCPDGSTIKTQWICAKETLEDLLKEGRIVFKKLKNGKYNVYKKFYENDRGGLVHPESIIYDLAYNQDGKEEIKDIFNVKEGRDVPFENAKPSKLIGYLISLATKNNKAVILDFMAGSGTTGHAVLALNKKDNGHRQFILCTNNENSICVDICYPRLKKVIEGYKNIKNYNIEGFGSNLKYFKTSFVKKTLNPDQLKINITNKCTEMLCLKEYIFDLAKESADYKIFIQGNRIMAVYYSFLNDSLRELKKQLDKMKGQKMLYCFTLDPFGLDKNNFAGWDDVILEPIPQKILDIYEEIYEY